MKKILLLITGLLIQIINAQVVTTFAGSTVSGYVDGTGTDAKFYGPDGICTDASGNVYVADNVNNRIRKITKNGEVTTFAGGIAYNPVSGKKEEILSRPAGICTDGLGNMYVSCLGNWHRIMKITPDGTVSLFAGYNQGDADGLQGQAKFNNPTDVCVDSSGNVYVADSGNDKIRKISPYGEVTTLAGSTRGYADGSGVNAKFYSLNGIYIDKLKNLYVGETNSGFIRKITQDGEVSTLVDDKGVAIKFLQPSAVCMDGIGNMYVTEVYRVIKINPYNVVSIFAGSTMGFADGTGTESKFFSPDGICTDASGNIYVADSGNNKIRKITMTSLDIEENSTVSKIMIYPNPVKSNLTINTQENIDKIELFDFLGKNVYTKESPEKNVNVDFLSKGVYILNIISDKGTTNYKIIKE